MSYFTRYLQRLVKFWQRKKSGKSVLLLNCLGRVDLQRPDNTVLTLCSVSRLKGAGKKCTWSFIGGILRYGFSVSVCMRNSRKEKYFDLDSVKNKKNKIATNKKTS